MRSVLTHLIVALATICVLLAPANGRTCASSQDMPTGCCPCDNATEGHDLARRPPCCDMSAGDQSTTPAGALADAPRVPDAPVATIAREGLGPQTRLDRPPLGTLGARGPPAAPIFKRVCVYLL